MVRGFRETVLEATEEPTVLASFHPEWELLLSLPPQARATAPTPCSPAWPGSPPPEPPWPASPLTATAADTHLSGCPPRGLCLVGAPPPARYRFATCRHPSSPASLWWTRWNPPVRAAQSVCRTACLPPAAPAKASPPASITPSWAFSGQTAARAVPLTCSPAAPQALPITPMPKRGRWFTESKWVSPAFFFHCFSFPVLISCVLSERLLWKHTLYYLVWRKNICECCKKTFCQCKNWKQAVFYWWYLFPLQPWLRGHRGYVAMAVRSPGRLAGTHMAV